MVAEVSWPGAAGVGSMSDVTGVYLPRHTTASGGSPKGIGGAAR